MWLACLLSVLNVAHESGSGYYARHYITHLAPRSYSVCMVVANRAARANLDYVEVITISRVETGHRFGLISSAGARGPLQVLPKYYAMRASDRDWIDPALRAWAYIRHHRRYGRSFRHAAGRYNGSGYKGKYALYADAHRRYLVAYTALYRWVKSLSNAHD